MHLLPIMNKYISYNQLSSRLFSGIVHSKESHKVGFKYRLTGRREHTVLCSRLFSTRPDPFARRPTKKCDPYGQAGKPLTVQDAERLSDTVDSKWNLEVVDSHATGIKREFQHADFLAGSSFLNHVAAVAQMNDHFPSVKLERRLLPRQKAWKVISSVTCSTRVLNGLSHHDFYLATLIDVEIDRPEVKSLILEEYDEE